METYPLDKHTRTIVNAMVVSSAVAEGERKPVEGLPTRRVSICVYQNTVESITPLSDGKSVQLPVAGKFIDLPPDCLLIPALVDCHAHLVLDGIHGFKSLNGPAPHHLISSRLEKMFKAGVLAVRDGGDRYNTAWDYTAQSWKIGHHHLPRIVTTGKAIFRRGHYGLKLGDVGINHHHQAVDQILRLKKIGINQLKVVLSGLVNLDEPGTVGPVQFSVEELKYIVQAAKKQEMPVMVHASSDKAVQIAIEAGVHTVEHGYFISDESLERMAAKKIAWVPTVAPMAALSDSLRRSGQASRADTARQAVEQHLEMINRAYSHGVTLGIGTDAGSPGVSWEKGYAQELLLFARAGLPPGVILELATKNGASLLGLQHQMGAIATGKNPYWLAVKPEFLRFDQGELSPQGIFWPAP